MMKWKCVICDDVELVKGFVCWGCYLTYIIRGKKWPMKFRKIRGIK